ncbi:MAG TPA: septation protein A [Gammaproteobacteria bacterium]|nr:septation protein A [Gammaproteobacteria bacterium]
MALFFDFLPIILFFIAYKLWGIYAATAIMLVVSVLQMAVTWLIKKEVRRLHIIATVLVLVFGGLTLIVHDPIFVKWKPTIVEWLFAATFLGSHWFAKKPLIRLALEEQITLPDQVWRRLNLAWVAFFAIVGAANLWVVYNFSTDTWVNFKLFGMLGATLIFALGQGIYLSRHLQEE